MKEAYCSFEVAKLLKEKGFDGESYGIYIDENTFEELDFKSSNTPETSVYRIVAPTHQMAMAWIREKGYHIYSFYLGDWNFVIQKLDEDWEYHKSGYNSHEEAIEAALKHTLENLI